MSEDIVQATTETTEIETGTTEEVSKLEELEKEDLIKYAKKLRSENAKTRVEKQATKKELEEFQAWKDSQKTELEKAQEQAAKLQKENHSLLKTSIALGAGLSTEDVEFISGDTPDEMKASAEKLAGKIKAGAPAQMVTDVFAGARGTPVGSGPRDSKTIANSWLSGLVFKD